MYTGRKTLTSEHQQRFDFLKGKILEWRNARKDIQSHLTHLKHSIATYEEIVDIYDDFLEKGLYREERERAYLQQDVYQKRIGEYKMEVLKLEEKIEQCNEHVPPFIDRATELLNGYDPDLKCEFNRWLVNPQATPNPPQSSEGMSEPAVSPQEINPSSVDDSNPVAHCITEHFEYSFLNDFLFFFFTVGIFYVVYEYFKRQFKGS